MTTVLRKEKYLRGSAVLTAGEEYIPQLKPNTERGSGLSIENFLCSSDILNLCIAKTEA